MNCHETRSAFLHHSSYPFIQRQVLLRVKNLS